MRFAALRASTGRFSGSYLAAGLDPGGFPRASTRYVCGAAAIPPCAANGRQPDAVCESHSCHRSRQPVRLTRCRTPRRSPISRSLARVDAKKRPSNRSPPSLSIRLCQLWALQFSRSKIPASSAEIEALPWRKCSSTMERNRPPRREERQESPGRHATDGTFWRPRHDHHPLFRRARLADAALRVSSSRRRLAQVSGRYAAHECHLHPWPDVDHSSLLESA